MTKRRKNKSVEEIVKTKTMIAEIVIGLAIIYINTMIAIMNNLIVISIISTIVSIILYIIISILIYREYMKQETRKYNERVCKKKLSKSKYTKVIPKDCTKFSEEFLDDLQNKRIVKFYARLIKLRNKEAVRVDIKYVKESKYIEYDTYLLGHFIDYYEIV
ncbi:MAG: hypothetical protein HFJ41_04470 [Clostridia bacterium]|nr:hypothetical protein [Clostridia bacterium]